MTDFVILDLDRLILVQHEDKLGFLMSRPAPALNISDHGLQGVKTNDKIASREVKTFLSHATIPTDVGLSLNDTKATNWTHEVLIRTLYFPSLNSLTVSCCCLKS